MSKHIFHVKRFKDQISLRDRYVSTIILSLSFSFIAKSKYSVFTHISIVQLSKLYLISQRYFAS